MIQCLSKADKSDIVCNEKIPYFFTSDEYDLYFSLPQTEAVSTIAQLISSRKNLECKLQQTEAVPTIEGLISSRKNLECIDFV